MQFEEFAKQRIFLISHTLETQLALFQEHVKNTHPYLLPLTQEFITRTTGGKMLRGTFVLLGHYLVNNDIPDELFKIAAAYEIVHTSLLVHDDVMDKNEMRRGKPSLHKALGDNHYALSQTINLGDLGYFLSFQTISNTHFDNEKKTKVLSLYSQVLVDTALGQMLDIELPNRQERLEQDIEKIYKNKTAQYSVSSPLMIGALFAGISDHQLEMIKEFGENLGIAFQILDDVLGIFGKDEVTGKSSISDVKEGKNTLLLTYALKQGNEQQKIFLNKYYGNENLTIGEFEEIKTIFEQTGALNYAKQKADDYTKNARQTIPNITNDKNNQQLLESLCDYLSNRKK